MPNGDGRIPPVAFNMSDDQYNRIFGKSERAHIRQALDTFRRKRERLERVACKRLDVPAEGGWGRVQGQEQAEDEEVRDVR